MNLFLMKLNMPVKNSKIMLKKSFCPNSCKTLYRQVHLWRPKNVSWEKFKKIKKMLVYFL